MQLIRTSRLICKIGSRYRKKMMNKKGSSNFEQKDKYNPIQVGEPGVGKTAIAEELHNGLYMEMC